MAKSAFLKADCAGEAECLLMCGFGWSTPNPVFLLQGIDFGDYLSGEAVWLGGQFIRENNSHYLYFFACSPSYLNISVKNQVSEVFSAEYQSMIWSTPFASSQAWAWREAPDLEAACKHGTMYRPAKLSHSTVREE